MSYTPINWQTGDTITADKLNRCDNGWGTESTQLFSETVTTTDTGHGFSAGSITYSTTIDAALITVTFDGTDYECPRIDIDGSYFYGGFSTGPDFTNFPFFITSGSEGNKLITQTAGAHTVAVVGEFVMCGPTFIDAVSSVIKQLQIAPLWLEQGVTTKDEFDDALNNYRIICFDAGTGIHYVSGMTGSDIVYVPEDANIRAYFDVLNNTFAIEWS